MKKLIRFFLLLILLGTLAPVPCVPAEENVPESEEKSSLEGVEEDTAEKAEWTVLLYLCGSDLESQYGLASGNLEEIAGCMTYSPEMDSYVIGMGEALEDPELRRPEKVNIVIETGGSREWHTEKTGMKIDAGKLQRWRYAPLEQLLSDESSFRLEEELPSASMADPETLSDFIRWGAEAYPARKYALVLWDHGQGSRSGFLIDELYGGDMLYLDELKNALKDGGIFFESVILDACMMANLETACALKNSAAWMVASEEVVAGQGTALGSWLQQLMNAPACGGQTLGRWICDMTQIKYANENDTQIQSILTWSVIDLSAISRVEECFDDFFEECGRVYEISPPELLTSLMYHMEQSEAYGSNDNMYDLAGTFYGELANLHMDRALWLDMISSLNDAVVYTAKGTGRGAARGLSFCLATNLTPEELDTYARGCPSASYLAFLDAITPAWTAPEWVYETTMPLTDIRDLEEYQIVVEKRIAPDGTPGVNVTGGCLNAVDINVDLLRLDEESGETVRIGVTRAISDATGSDEDIVYRVWQPWLWPAVEGVTCCAEMVGRNLSDYLINVPVQIGTQNWILRCGYLEEEDAYIIYGLWEGYDMDSGLFNRNVRSLSQMTGQEFRLLYPIVTTGAEAGQLYETSEALTMYRTLEMKEQPLPEGTYVLDYWISDMFMRRLPVGSVKMIWDGSEMTIASGESWEGNVALTLPEE